MKLTENQLALLLLLEDFAVTNYGRVTWTHLRAGDEEQCKRWNEEGFIDWGTESTDKLGASTSGSLYGYHFYVALSDKAWDMAHAGRKAIGNKNSLIIPDRPRQLRFA